MFSRNSLTYYLVTVVAIAASMPEYNAFADDSAEQALDEVSTFDIPEQSLDAALLAFSEQAGVQIVMAAATARDLDSSAVTGEQSNRRALEQLLDNRGLSYTEHRHRTIAVHVVQQEQGGDSEAKNSGPSPTPALMAQNRMPSEQSREGQTNRAIDDEDERVEPRLEEIVVTGSRIRGAESASPIVTVDRAEIERSGFATVEEVIENLPQNFGAGATSDALNITNSSQAIGGSVANLGGGTSVNLRGLGASSTLVLVNGRRLSPAGTAARFTNIASIPLTAVERIEVLTDGASAIYGSDAIAGVINFIMRSDYEGAETRLRYASDGNGDTSDVQFGQVLGTSWSSGNVLFSYEFYDRDALAAADREFAASNDLSSFGGTDNRDILGGSPANIVADGQIFAIPAGQDGTSLTAADFDPAAAPNLYNANEFADLIGQVERHSATLYLNQDIGSVNLFGQARFSTQDTTNRNPLNFWDLVNIPVTQASPFFVDPTGTGLTEVTVANYSIAHDFGPRISNAELESWGATTGARLELGNDWSIELVGNWAREDAEQRLSNVVDVAALLTAANNPDPNLAFNPFGDGSNTNPASLSSFIGEDVSGGISENELWSVNLNADGSLFDVGGGAVRLAAGVDYRNEALFRENGTRTIVVDRSRSILAAYAEVFFPLVGESNARNGLRRLELSVAARFEDYDDFGHTTNPKLGVLWSPSSALMLRGTYGTSFRAPSLVDLDASPSVGNATRYIPGFFSAVPFAFLQLGGSNENLRPEEATTWTAGFQWRPVRARGLSIDVTYFNIDFDDRISSPIRSAFTAVTDPVFAGLVTLNPSIDEITAVVNDPRYDPDFPFWPFNVPAEDLISGAAPVGAILFNRRVNSAQLVVTGTQVQLAYSADTPIGVFGFNLNGDYLFDFERRIIATNPLVEEVDTLGRPVDFRARGNVNWSRGNWTVSGFINYTDGYSNEIRSTASEVDSWTTVDLTVAYSFGEGAGFLTGTRFALTTQNLFDEDPPFVDTIGGIGYDATAANPVGQYFAFQLTKDW